MGEHRGGWPFAALVVLAAVAPFNVTLMRDPWTDVLLRPLLIFALAVGLVLTVVGLVGPGRRPLDAFDALAFVWLAAMWLSASLSEMPSFGAAGAARFSVAVLTAVGTRNVVYSRTQVSTVLRALAVGTLAGVAIGLVVLAVGHDVGGTENLAGSITGLGPWDRLTRPWQHANVAAMALGATGATVLMLRRRAVAMASLVLIVVALVLTYSRGGLVAGLGAALFWLVLRRRRNETVAVLGLIGVGLIVMVAAPGWAVRLEQPGDRAWYAARIEPGEVVVDLDGGLVQVTVTNESLVNWPAGGDDRVMISARWLDRDEGLVWGEHQWTLPNDLGPGDSLTTGLVVDPLIPNGEYDVRWDLTIPFRAYFGQFLGEEPILTSGLVSESTVSRQEVKTDLVVQRAIDLDRRGIWRLAWDGFVDSPVLGSGPLQLGSANQLTSADRLPGGHAHNILLEPLASWGLVGTLPFVVLAVGAFARTTRLAWVGRDRFAAVVSVCLLAVGVHGLVDWPMVFVTLGIPIGIFIGLGWSTDRWAEHASN